MCAWKSSLVRLNKVDKLNITPIEDAHIIRSYYNMLHDETDKNSSTKSL